MRLTGRNQSETVNEALAKLTEDADIVAGVVDLLGEFPGHADHES